MADSFAVFDDTARALRGLPAKQVQVQRRVGRTMQSAARRGAPRRTGALQRSIVARVKASGIRMASDSPAAQIQEFGGTVRPNGGALRIPVGRVPSRIGKVSLSLATGADGRRYLVSKGRAPVVRFILRQQVQIPAVGFMRRAFDAGVTDLVESTDQVVGEVARG